jgi:[ribosomal protein S5]-alanine N-acetyltransferase
MMEECETMTLNTVFETDRLIVRHWHMDDLDAAFAMHGDPEVTVGLPDAFKHTHIEESQRHLEKAIREADPASPLGYWAVVERRSGAVIGGAVLIHAPINGGNPVEIGYYFARSAWGNGYATEIARALLDHGFSTTDETEIYGVTTLDNHASQRVLQKVGMERRGVGEYNGHPVEMFVAIRPEHQDTENHTLEKSPIEP